MTIRTNPKTKLHIANTIGDSTYPHKMFSASIMEKPRIYILRLPNAFKMGIANGPATSIPIEVANEVKMICSDIIPNSPTMYAALPLYVPLIDIVGIKMNSNINIPNHLGTQS